MDAASALNPAQTAAGRRLPIVGPPPAPIHRRLAHCSCRLTPSGRLPGLSASAHSAAATRQPSVPPPKPLRAYASQAGCSTLELLPTPPLHAHRNRHGTQTRCGRSAPPSASTEIARRHSTGRWASRRLPDRLRLTGGCHGWFLARRPAGSPIRYAPWAAGDRECRRLADEDPDRRNRPTSTPRRDGRLPIA